MERDDVERNRETLRFVRFGIPPDHVILTARVSDADLASLGYVHLSEPVPHNEAWAEWAKANGWVKLDGIDVSLALGRVLDERNLHDLDLLMDLSRAVLAAIDQEPQ